MTQVFFTDRDLGKQFPAILRTAGILVEAHHEHFAHDTPDDEWLPEVGRRGWVVLTHDQRIRYKSNERDAVMSNGVAMFVLIGTIPHPALAHGFVATHGRVVAFLARHSPPFIAKVYQGPADRAPGEFKPGHVELWLSKRDWRAR